MIEESETPEMGSQSKAGDVLAERRARRDAANDPAVIRRAEAAESVVRNLETHLAALEQRLEEVGQERERISEQLGEREREVVQIKQGEYAEQQLRVEAEDRNERAQKDMRAQIQALNARLDETEGQARALSVELEDVRRELSESQQSLALGERLRERSEELRERMAALEERFAEMQREVSVEREARLQAETELVHLRERDERLTPIVSELMEVAAELRTGFEHELAALREELQRQVVWERETYVRELTAMGSRMEDLRFELARTAADLRTQLAEPPPAALLQPTAAPESEREAAHRREMADALVSAVDRLRARVAQVRDLDQPEDALEEHEQNGHPVVEPPVQPTSYGEHAVVEPPAVEYPVAEPTVDEPTVDEPPVAEPSVAEPPVAEPIVDATPVVEPTVDFEPDPTTTEAAEPATPIDLEADVVWTNRATPAPLSEPTPTVPEPAPVVEQPVDAPQGLSAPSNVAEASSLAPRPSAGTAESLGAPTVHPPVDEPSLVEPAAVEQPEQPSAMTPAESLVDDLPAIESTAESPAYEIPVIEPEPPVVEASAVEPEPIPTLEQVPEPVSETALAPPAPRAGLSPSGIGIKPVTSEPVALRPRPMPVPPTRPSWLAPAIRRLAAKRDAKLAAELVIELIPAQQQIVDSAMHYQMKVDELGTFHVALESGHAVISREASSVPLDFTLEGSAAAFSELAAGGASRKPAGLRIRKGRRRAKRLIKARRSPIALADLAAEGIDVWPGLLLLVMAEAIDPSWTTGRRFELAFEIQDAPGIVIYVRICDGEGIVVSRSASKQPVATVSASSHALTCLLAGMPVPPDHHASVTGDSTSVEMFLQWAARAQGLVGSTL